MAAIFKILICVLISLQLLCLGGLLGLADFLGSFRGDFLKFASCNCDQCISSDNYDRDFNGFPNYRIQNFSHFLSSDVNRKAAFEGGQFK